MDWLQLSYQCIRLAEGAVVAFDLMLQEDWSHPINRCLAWYVCHLRLQELQEAAAEESEGAESEYSEEEV